MALITIITQDGMPILVATSVFDPLERRAPASTGRWSDVWARFDAAKIRRPLRGREGRRGRAG